MNRFLYCGIGSESSPDLGSTTRKSQENVSGSSVFFKPVLQAKAICVSSLARVSFHVFHAGCNHNFSGYEALRRHNPSRVLRARLVGPGRRRSHSDVGRYAFKLRLVSLRPPTYPQYIIELALDAAYDEEVPAARDVYDSDGVILDDDLIHTRIKRDGDYYSDAWGGDGGQPDESPADNRTEPYMGSGEDGDLVPETEGEGSGGNYLSVGSTIRDHSVVVVVVASRTVTVSSIYYASLAVKTNGQSSDN